MGNIVPTTYVGYYTLFINLVENVPQIILQETHAYYQCYTTIHIRQCLCKYSLPAL